MGTSQKRAAFFKGERAEKWAAFYLWLKGYKILEKRYKTPVGEIDIIARKPDEIVFVEVKARDTYEGAAYSITPRQKHRIIAAAKSFIMANPKLSECDMRFDAILILPYQLPNHIQDAWQADE